ncbi:hypothetical protein NUW54_g9270 [Trametes sanguinea]|uniref:Uncharacterized protein n=1 Tax=Trametes sanguinea TaxID=158606 RepID=A0ACC1P8M2_9APHY|nr:hypothetical protein NUW54_g9270 [Trametes sanguinea]
MTTLPLPVPVPVLSRITPPSVSHSQQPVLTARHVSPPPCRHLTTDVATMNEEEESLRAARARDRIGECYIGGKSTPHSIHTVSFQPRGVAYNEDRVVMDKWDVYGQPWLFLAVFDGHLGAATADYASTALPAAIRKKLHALDAVRDGHDRLETLLQLRRNDGLDGRLLLEDEAGEERDDFFRLVCGQRILEDELREDELVRRVDL